MGFCYDEKSFAVIEILRIEYYNFGKNINHLLRLSEANCSYFFATGKKGSQIHIYSGFLLVCMDICAATVMRDTFNETIYNNKRVDSIKCMVSTVSLQACYHEFGRKQAKGRKYLYFQFKGACPTHHTG